MAEPETMLRLVGRMQAAHDVIVAAMKELPHGSMHALDLMCVARDSLNKAIIKVWGSAPELQPEQQSDKS